MTRYSLILLASLAAPLFGQLSTPPGNVRSQVSPLTLSCTVGVSRSLLYNNGGVDSIYTCQGDPAAYALPPGSSTSVLTGAVGGTAGANHINGSANGIVQATGGGLVTQPAAYAATTHQFVTSFVAGAPVTAQPACGDLSNSSPSCATDATNAANISSGTLPAARLPNPTASTLGGIQSAVAVSTNFLTGISTSGVPTKTQPFFTDLGGAATAAQVGAVGTGLNGGLSPTSANCLSTDSGGKLLGSCTVAPGSLAAQSTLTLLSNQTGSTAAPAANSIVSLTPILGIGTNVTNYGNATSNSIASTIAQFSTNPNVGIIPSVYPTSEALPGESVNTAAIDQTILGTPCPTPGTAWFQDFRFGAPYDVMCDPTGNGSSPSVGKNHNVYYSSAFVYTQSIKPKFSENWNVNNLDGGMNYSSPALFNGKTTVGFHFQANDWTPGQTVPLSNYLWKLGTGDALTYGLYNFCYGGSNASNDQGCQPYDFQAIQGTVEYAGNVVGTPTTGQTSIAVTPTQGATFQGAGRFFLDLTTGTSSLSTTVVTNGASSPTILTTTGLTPSVTVGSLGSGVTTFNTPTTFTPSFTTGAIGSITTSTLICAYDGAVDFELVKPSAVTGSTFTISFQRPKSSTTSFTTGGHCGQFLVMTVDNKVSSQFTQTIGTISGTLRTAIPVVETPDSTHLWLWTASAGAWFKFSGLDGISMWTNPGAATLYQGAQVYSVQAGGTITNTLTLSPNSIAWGNGDNVTEPMWMFPHITGGINTLEKWFPSLNVVPSIGASYTLNGLWAGQDIGLSLANRTPTSFYAANGGTFQSPFGIKMQGEWNNGLYATQPTDSGLIFQSCISCTGTAKIIGGSSALGTDTLGLNQLTGEFTLTTGGATATYSFTKFGFQQSGNASHISAPIFYGTGSLPTRTNLVGTVAVNATSTDTAGSLTSSTTGTVTFTLTMAGASFPHRPVCLFTNETTLGTANLIQATQATPATTTAITATGTTISGDIISYSCTGY